MKAAVSTGRRGRPRWAAAVLPLALAACVVACEALVPAPAAPTPVATSTASGSPPSPSGMASATAAPAPSAGPSSSPATSPAPSPRSSLPPPPVVIGELGPVPAAALNADVAAFLRKTGTPGISVTIRYGDGRTWTGSAGFADVAGHVPVTATTAFAAGSITKTFTSAVVMRLVAEGRIALDAPIARYLRSPKLDPRITVRMLLDHTSGLFDVFLAPGIDHALQSAPTARWSTARALTYLRKPYFPPGRGWHYSNTNYLVLGLLVERVTGRSLAAEIRARILDPLDLDDTWFQGAERPRAVLAHGYRLAGPSASPRVTDLADGTGIAPFASVATALDGAGSVASTTADLARWASRLYGGGVLSTSTLGEMLADQQRTSGYIPGVLYGLGVQTYTIDGWTTLGHSGRVLGFRGAVRYVPAAGLTIAVLTNQSRADVAPLVARLLADVLPTSGPRLGPVAGRVR